MPDFQAKPSVFGGSSYLLSMAQAAVAKMDTLLRQEQAEATTLVGDIGVKTAHEAYHQTYQQGMQTENQAYSQLAGAIGSGVGCLVSFLPDMLAALSSLKLSIGSLSLTDGVGRIPTAVDTLYGGRFNQLAETNLQLGRISSWEQKLAETRSGGGLEAAPKAPVATAPAVDDEGAAGAADEEGAVDETPDAAIASAPSSAGGGTGGPESPSPGAAPAGGASPAKAADDEEAKAPAEVRGPKADRMAITDSRFTFGATDPTAYTQEEIEAAGTEYAGSDDLKDKLQQERTQLMNRQSTIRGEISARQNLFQTLGSTAGNAAASHYTKEGANAQFEQAEYNKLQTLHGYIMSMLQAMMGTVSSNVGNLDAAAATAAQVRQSIASIQSAA